MPGEDAGPGAEPVIDPLVASAEEAVRRAEADASHADAPQTPEPDEREDPAGPVPPEPARETVSAQDGPAPGSDLPDDATMALFLPALAEPETRPETDPGPYAIGPDAHDRVPDTAEETGGQQEPAPSTRAEPVTDKGLPKRTPKLTTPAAVPRPRTSGSVDADALRRRLGGFRRGAEAGRRDVEAEIADRPGQDQAPDTGAGTTEEATGAPSRRQAVDRSQYVRTEQ